jgi:hypothetical protein
MSKRKAGAAADYAKRAIERLLWLLDHAESEQAQVSAAKELLNRVRGGGGEADANAAALEEAVARLRDLRGAREGKAR